MAIVQYRTSQTGGGWRYSAPNSTEVSQLIPPVGDWLAVRTSSDQYKILSGSFDDGLFTGRVLTIDTNENISSSNVENESVTIYNETYVYSNMWGYKCVQNIRADTASAYMIQFSGFVLCVSLVLGGAYKCVKSFFVRRRSSSL